MRIAHSSVKVLNCSALKSIHYTALHCTTLHCTTAPFTTLHCSGGVEGRREGKGMPALHNSSLCPYLTPQILASGDCHHVVQGSALQFLVLQGFALQCSVVKCNVEQSQVL